MSTTQGKDENKRLFSHLDTGQLKVPEDQPWQEESIIVQPMFVFEKGEQTFKRPAADTLYEATEHESGGFSRKRVRSSSFTLHATKSQTQGVGSLSQKRLRSSSFTDVPTFPPFGPGNDTIRCQLLEPQV